MGIRKHTPRTCMSKNISFLTTRFKESQVSGLAKLGFGKSWNLPNLNYESHAMRVTCIIMRIILYTTYNILHIAHNVLHIIRSYAMRPWNHGLDIRTSQNEGSTHVTATREPSLANTESFSYIHTYFIFRSFIY